MKTILVVGATGDVGRGVVSQSLHKGWQVIAVARNETRLKNLQADYLASSLFCVRADLNSEEAVAQLWRDVHRHVDRIDAVVISVNAPIMQQTLMTMSAQAVLDNFSDNLLTHFIAAKTLLPLLADNTLYMGIGGGTADFLMPNMGHLSMVQAALRMMYRTMVLENKERAVIIKELMILSLVNGVSTRDIASDSWLTESEIGEHICAIISEPAQFAEPVLTLKSRSQIGRAK